MMSDPARGEPARGTSLLRENNVSMRGRGRKGPEFSFLSLGYDPRADRLSTTLCHIHKGEDIIIVNFEFTSKVCCGDQMDHVEFFVN